MTIPRSLGRYEVIEFLGHGGMAALYRARDPRIGRYVAIKQLRPQFDTPELRERFAREAAAAGGLSHANIVTIYDVGEEDGLPFIAMEFVQGETFADLVKLRPPLPIPRKIALTEEVCAGLAHAHEAGIVHRDIKPANLIVGPEGIVKILDFGVAKLAAGGTTVPGAIIGTLNYMSPEQIRGIGVDARTDIFSVGAVLYELLSHRQAFPGRVPDDVFQRILNGEPTPLAELAPGLDGRLIDLVQCALEKDPDQRIQDISTLQQELAIVRLSVLAAEQQRPVPRRTVTSAGSAALQTPPPVPPGKEPSRRADVDLAAKRATQIAGHLANAERAFESGDYDAAIESCKQVLLLDAIDERAILLLDRIHAAIDDQQERARLAEQERQRDASIRLSIEEAYRRFDGGQHEAALQSLESLEPSSHPLLADALHDLRHAFRGIQEERRIQAERAERHRRLQRLLDEGRVAVQQDRLDDAERLLDSLRELDAEASEVQILAELVSSAREAARLNAQIDQALRDFDLELGRGDFSKAADVLEAAAALAVDDQRVRAGRRRLDQARAALAAREAAEAKRRKGEQQLDLAGTHLESGDLTAAADRLALAAAALTSQHAGVVALSDRLQKATEERAAAEAAARLQQEVAELVAGASRRFESAGGQTDEHLLALGDVDRALSLSPENLDARQLKAAIEASLAAHREAARVKAVINNARTRFANGKHQTAFRLLEDFRPAHPEVTAALTELRDALAKLEEEKRAERERIERKQQEAARLKAELERLLAEVDDRLAADDLSAVSALVDEAETRAAADARVQAARQRLDKALTARAAAEALAREAEEHCAAAEASFERGDLDEASNAVTRALKANPQHAHAQALSIRVAAALEERATAEAAERRRRTADELVAAAATHLQDAGVHADQAALAMQKVTEALALDPSHEEALSVKAAAETALVAHRHARAAIRNARNRFSLGKHRAAIQLLEGLDPTLQPLVAQTLQELRHELDEIEERRRREQESAGDATILIAGRVEPGAEPNRPTGDAEAPSDPAHGDTRISPWGFVAGAVVLLFLLIVIVLYRFRIL